MTQKLDNYAPQAVEAAATPLILRQARWRKVASARRV